MSQRSIARLVGALFVIATVAGAVSLAMQLPLLESLSAAMTVDASTIATSALLELIMGGAIVAITIAVHPVIRQHSERLALGYVAARTIEAVMIAFDAVILLTLLTLTQYGAAGPAEPVLYDLLAAQRDWAGVAVTTAFTLGALIFYFALYVNRLVPRWLSGWGLAGAVLYMIGGLAMLYGQSRDSTLVIALSGPLAVQEMALAAWLIIKGFSRADTTPVLNPGR